MLHSIRNNEVQSIAYNFYQSFHNPGNRVYYYRTRFARCTWIQRTKVQTSERDKEKNREDTKRFISSHLQIELTFCLEQEWKGWKDKNAGQNLLKCAPRRMLHSIRNNEVQSIAYNFYPSFHNPGNRCCYIRTRFARCTWIQRITVQTNDQDKDCKGEDTK
jgi:hypothetical protein